MPNLKMVIILGLTFCPLSAAFVGIGGIALSFLAPYMGPLLVQIPRILNACIEVPLNTIFVFSIMWKRTNVWVSHNLDTYKFL